MIKFLKRVIFGYEQSRSPRISMPVDHMRMINVLFTIGITNSTALVLFLEKKGVDVGWYREDSVSRCRPKQ
jgi:hypothetical protein